jgi:ribonuclease HI
MKMKNYDYIIYTDGGGASSFVGGRFVAVKTKDGKSPIEILYKTHADKLTCNEAEYYAVLLALEEMEYHAKVKVLSDSMLVVNQLAPENPWKINYDHLRILNGFVKDVINNFDLDVVFEYIPRDHNLAGLYLEGKLKAPDEIVINVE